MPELSPKRWGRVVRQIVRKGIPGSGNSMSKITKGWNSLEFELNSKRQWEPLKDSELGNGFINLPFFFLFFWPRHAACGILVPQPGIEPMPPIMEVQSLNHWIARETPTLHFRMITLAGSSVRNTAREERLHKTVRWETIRAAKELKEHCHLFIYFWLLLGLCCCMRAFSSFSEQGLLSTYVGFSLRWLLLL